MIVLLSGADSEDILGFSTIHIRIIFHGCKIFNRFINYCYFEKNNKTPIPRRKFTCVLLVLNISGQHMDGQTGKFYNAASCSASIVLWLIYPVIHCNFQITYNELALVSIITAVMWDVWMSCQGNNVPSLKVMSCLKDVFVRTHCHSI